MTTTEYLDKALAVLERIALALESKVIVKHATAAQTPQWPTDGVILSPPAARPEPEAPGTPAAVATYTYDQICDAINGYADRHGQQDAKKLLLTFGATYIKQLKPEQYPDVMEKFK